MAEWVKIGEVGELAPGEKKQVDLDGLEVALFNVDGEYYVIEDVCTHDGAPLAHGKFAARKSVARDTALASTCAPARPVHAGHRAGGYLRGQNRRQRHLHRGRSVKVSSAPLTGGWGVHSQLGRTHACA